MEGSSEFFQVQEVIYRGKSLYGGKAWNFSKSQSLNFFQVLELLNRVKAIYDNSHLALLGASLFWVPEPIQGSGGYVADQSLCRGKVRNISKS